MHAPLEREVLRFIRAYSAKTAPEPVFNALALKVFRYQFQRNTFYRRFCEMEGRTPSSVKSWKDVPAMPARAFKELVLTTFPVRKKVRVFKTSGTTLRQAQGEAREGRGAHYFETLALYEASILPPFASMALGTGPYSFHFLMPRPEEARDSSLSYMMGVADKRFAKGRARYYVENGRPLYEKLERALTKEKKKVFLASTAFALKGFLDFLEERKTHLRLPRGSRLMETGGFKGKTKEISKGELYRLCREYLGIAGTECVSEYGMTELSSQYYNRNQSLFCGPAWLRAAAMDPSTGKECRPGRVGLLKHVDLANLGSVMAVQTEDLGKRRGKGFEVLGRVSGAEARGCSLSYERFLRSSS